VESVEAPGEFGPRTQFRYRMPCEVCGGLQEIAEILSFHLNVLAWSGAQIVSCVPEFAVTPSLKAVLQQEDIKGVEFKDMLTTISEDYEEVPTLHGLTPRFEWLSIGGTATGPYTNYRLIGVCRKCERDIWQPCFEVEESAYGLPNKTLVSRRSWTGADIFKTREPGVCIVTERFWEILERVGSEGVQLVEADWVD